MDAEFFEDYVLKNRLYLIEKIAGAKGDEYTRDGDRLGNFKRAASLLRCTPEKALMSFVAKHIIALYDFLNELERGNIRDMNQWLEKTGDIIVYMILLEGLLIERFDEESKMQCKDNIRMKGE